MAKTLNEIVYSVLESLSGFHLTDDFRISPIYIEKLAASIRESLIRDELKQGNLSSEYYQLYPCLKIRHEDANCLDNGAGATQWSGYTAVVPNLVSGIGDSNIIHMAVGETVYSPVRPESFFGRMKYGYGRFINAYTLLGNKVYFKGIAYDNKDGCDKIGMMIALFSDPMSVVDCGVEYENMQYPVPSDYKLEVLIKKDILSVYGIPFDNINNTVDDTNVQKQVRAPREEEDVQ